MISTGCEKNNPMAPVPLPRPPNVSGEWDGTIVSASLSVTLEETDGIIEGNGTFVDRSYFILDGKNRYPEIVFTMKVSGYIPFVFTGTFVDSGKISGSVSGSGFNGNQLILTRKLNAP